MYELITNNDCD